MSTLQPAHHFFRGAHSANTSEHISNDANFLGASFSSPDSPHSMGSDPFESGIEETSDYDDDPQVTMKTLVTLLGRDAQELIRYLVTEPIGTKRPANNSRLASGFPQHTPDETSMKGSKRVTLGKRPWSFLTTFGEAAPACKPSKGAKECAARKAKRSRLRQNPRVSFSRQEFSQDHCVKSNRKVSESSLKPKQTKPSRIKLCAANISKYCT